MLLTILGYLLTSFGYLLLIIIVVLFTLLVVPYHYRLTGEKSEESRLEGSITWLFGGVRIDFIRSFPGDYIVKLTLFRWIRHTFKPKSPGKIKKTTPNKKHGLSVKDKYANKHSAMAAQAEESKAGEKSKSGKKSKESSRLAREFLKPAVFKEAFSTVLKILRHFQPKILILSVKVGFSDPMVTGILYGLLSQFHFLIQKHHDIQVQSVFDEECLEGKFLIGGRVWIPTLLFMILGFLISKPVRSIYIPKLLNKLRKSKGGPQYVNQH